jgi:hypothetical protein
MLRFAAESLRSMAKYLRQCAQNRPMLNDEPVDIAVRFGLLDAASKCDDEADRHAAALEREGKGKQ